MVENNGHIHVYSPRAGAYNTPVQNISVNIKSSVDDDDDGRQSIGIL